jgi:hypothetical protein
MYQQYAELADGATQRTIAIPMLALLVRRVPLILVARVITPAIPSAILAEVRRTQGHGLLGRRMAHVISLLPQWDKLAKHEFAKRQVVVVC